MKKLLTFICAVLIAGMILTAISASDTSFEDVSDTAWYYPHITNASERGLMQGMGDGLFGPEESLTRAQYITILWRLAKAEPNAENTFSDVSDDAWYAPYVGWAVKSNIVSGYPDNTFRGDAPVSRQELMVMTARYLDFKWLTLPSSADAAHSFTDRDEIADWASPYVEAMREAAIVKGNSEGAFSPLSTATRAEIATMIVRLDDAVKALGDTRKINGSSLSDFSLYSSELTPEQLASVSQSIEKGTGIKLPSSEEKGEKCIVFEIDEALRMLEYKARLTGNCLSFAVSSEYATAYFENITEDLFKDRSVFSITDGFSYSGTFILDEAVSYSEDELSFVLDTNKNPLAYDVGEEVTLRVNLLCGRKLVSVPFFEYSYYLEDGRTFSGFGSGYTGQLVLTLPGCSIPGSADISVSLKNRKKVAINSLRGVSLRGGVVFGFDEIDVTTPMPDDFNQFWDAQQESLMACEPEEIEFYVCEETSTDRFIVYEAVVKSPIGNSYSHISVPRDAAPGSLKIMGSFFGAHEPRSEGANHNEGCITVTVSPHSIANHLPEEEYTKYTEEIAGWGFDEETRSEGYFLGMHMRNVQALRFAEVKFAELWNGVDLEVSGGSMGGYQSIGAAALYDRITAAYPGAPWVCDIGGPTLADRVKGTSPEYTECTKYYDGVYLATRIKCPVHINSGYGDSECPPTGIVALYNAIKSEKSLSLNQCREHGYMDSPYNYNSYINSDYTEIPEDARDITDTGCALPLPNYDPDRPMTESELAMEALAKKMASAEKYLTGTYPNKDAILIEDFTATITELLQKHGLEDDCRVEIDVDSFGEVQQRFSETEDGKQLFTNLEYSIYDAKGGFCDVMVRVRLTKNIS